MASTARNITTNTTTIINSGPTKLVRIAMNLKSTGAGAAKFYDSNLASPAAASLFASVDWSASVDDLLYDVWCKNGLVCVTTAATTPGDITVMYE
jgi:hypothetical protein